MAQEGNLERRCSDKALKIQALIRGFVGSLSEILNEDDLLEDETNVIGSVLRETEAELKNRMEQLRRLRTDTTSEIASAFERDDILAGSSVHNKQRCAYPESEVGISRHFRNDHQELMNLSLWETFPVEVVERICAMLPLSKIFEFLKLCEPWSRLPTATRFRQFCAKVHGDLFEIVMHSIQSRTYRLAIYDFNHKEWSHLELSTMRFEEFFEEFKFEDFVFGRDGGLMCVIPHHFYTFEEPPRILVFNPLTGDKKYIGVSSFTASLEKREVNVVLLQLIVDGELGCYKLILVTQRTRPRAVAVYFSESYDSMSGIWSTLDSGFVYGDGMLGDRRQHVCFDCRLKKFCIPARNPHSEVTFYFSNVTSDSFVYDPYCTFVRDHRFKLEFISTAKVLESVWQNGWNEKSKISLAMERPDGDFEARLLACTRYILVVAVGVADEEKNADSEDCRQRLALYDRVTCEEVLNIPQFMTEEFSDDEEFIDVEDFMHRNIQFMCDLKWDVVP